MDQARCARGCGRSFGSGGIAAARVSTRNPFGEGILVTGGRAVSVGFAEQTALADSVAAMAGFRLK